MSAASPGGDLSTVHYSISGGVAEIRLDRPRVRNAQSRILLEEMDAAFSLAEHDSEVRVVILTAAGDHFSSGHDLGTEEELADRSRRPRGESMADRYVWFRARYLETALRWRDFPKPTIASVQGYCLYGGWLIASAMDFIIAADDALFLPGLVQYFSAPWDLGIRRAKETLFRGQLLSAAEAERSGFVNQVVPRDELEATTRAVAAEIADRDPFELRMLKSAINSAQDHMGFRNSVVDSYQHYSLMMSEAHARGDRIGGQRLNKVAQSLARHQPDATS